jgi:hypothetical protein
MFASRIPTGPTTSARFKQLGTGEMFVISSMRLWLLPQDGSHGDYPDWRQGFTHAQLGAEGTAGFDDLCRILATGARKPLCVHRLGCPTLARHESWTLHALSFLQRDRFQEAQTIFEQRCLPTAARLAMTPAIVFASALRSRRLWVAFHNRCSNHRHRSIANNRAGTSRYSTLQ